MPISRSILAFILLFGTIAQAIEVDELDTIVAAGAVELAAKLMLSEDVPSLESADKWLKWQQLRLDIMLKQQDWSKIAAFLQSLPSDLPPPLAEWRKRELANAYLQLNDGFSARQLYRQLLWGNPQPAEIDSRFWRFQIMRSYLVEQNAQDAEIAMRKFRQDYGAEELEKTGLTGQVLQALGRTEPPGPDAIDVFNRQWRKQPNTATEIRHKLKLMLKEDELPVMRQAAAWSLLEQIARADLDLSGRVEALENQLMLAQPSVAKELRGAYFEMAQGAGNQARLLMGDDAAWMRLGDQQQKIDARLARAVYAQLAAKAGAEQVRVQAYLKLANSMLDIDPEGELQSRFFGIAAADERAMVLPSNLGYLLVNSFYKYGQQARAVEAMDGQDNLPQAADPVAWALARARTNLTQSNAELAAEVLATMLEKSPMLSDRDWQTLDQMLLEFELAKAGAALVKVGNAMLLQDLDISKTRELLYLIAEAHGQQGQHLQAARRYLYSAGYVDPGETDAWARASRTRAADSLAAAGLIDDSLVLYRNLLANAQSEVQRWQLRRVIKQVIAAKRSLGRAAAKVADPAAKAPND